MCSTHVSWRWKHQDPFILWKCVFFYLIWPGDLYQVFLRLSCKQWLLNLHGVAKPFDNIATNTKPTPLARVNLWHPCKLTMKMLGPTCLLDYGWIWFDFRINIIFSQLILWEFIGIYMCLWHVKTTNPYPSFTIMQYPLGPWFKFMRIWNAWSFILLFLPFFWDERWKAHANALKSQGQSIHSGDRRSLSRTSHYTK